MANSGPLFPRHDPEASWQALVSHGLAAQAMRMAQTTSQISQVASEMGQSGANRWLSVQVMRELARIVMRDAEGLIALTHVAEAMIPVPAPLPPQAPPVAEAERLELGGQGAGASSSPEADALQAWREASDDAFFSHLTAWMAVADVDQEELCRELGYKPVYIRRIMRGTDPITRRFRERLLDYAARRGSG